MRFRCDAGHLRAVETRCASEDCVACAEGPLDDTGRRDVSKSYLGRRRARTRAPRVWQNLDGRALLHTVFTVPLELRPLAGDREWWELRVRALRRQLKLHWDLDWALVSYHPTGDKGGQDKFHPHIHVLWVRRDDNGVWPAGPSGWLEPATLQRLRRLWADVLGWDAEVNVNHTFVDARDPAAEAKVWHRVQYILRSFPGWSEWRGNAPRWWGHCPPRLESCGECGETLPDDHDDVCPCCGVAVGLLCTVCGGKLHYEGITRTAPAGPIRPDGEEVHRHGPRPGGT